MIELPLSPPKKKKKTKISINLKNDQNITENLKNNWNTFRTSKITEIPWGPLSLKKMTDMSPKLIKWPKCAWNLKNWLKYPLNLKMTDTPEPKNDNNTAES